MLLTWSFQFIMYERLLSEHYIIKSVLRWLLTALSVIFQPVNDRFIRMLCLRGSKTQNKSLCCAYKRKHLKKRNLNFEAVVF